MRRTLLVLAVLATGCPGIRRPPPSAQRAAPTAAEPVTPPSPTVSDTPASPAASGAERLRQDLAAVRVDYERFLTAPTDHDTWERIMDRIQAVEDAGFALLDSEADPGLEPLLEELGDLRADLSDREP
jgi:hypothetical protein